MKNKIKIREKASDRAKRLLLERELSEKREFLRNPKSDLRIKSGELVELSKNIRKKTSKSIISDLILAIQLEGDITKVKTSTPEAVKLISKMIDLTNKVENLHPVQAEKQNKQNLASLKELSSLFEIHLRKLFDHIETGLNGLVLNFDDVKSFNTVVEETFRGNIITTIEYKILKLFGQLRNLFMHNSSASVLVHTLMSDELTFYKAVILEARDTLLDLMHRYLPRLIFFQAYTMLNDDNDDRPQDLLDTLPRVALDSYRSMRLYEAELNIEIGNEYYTDDKVSILLNKTYENSEELQKVIYDLMDDLEITQ